MSKKHNKKRNEGQAAIENKENKEEVLSAEAETAAENAEPAEAEEASEEVAAAEVEAEPLTEAAEEAAPEKAAEGEPAPENAPEEEAAQDGTAEEKEYSAAEGTDAGLLSDFAPRPINIPNVDLEKEKRRQEKRSKKRSKERKKVEARKKKGRKKRLSTGQKVAMGFASFILFLIFTVTMTAFEAVMSVRLTTSPYAIHVAVKNMDTGEIPISQNSNKGRYIPDYAAIGAKSSSSRAALVDMIRDNASGNITYSEILSSIRSSGMDEFIEAGISSAAEHLLLDKPYKEITGEDIMKVIREDKGDNEGSGSLVQTLTGRKLGDVMDETTGKTGYDAITEYFNSNGRLDDISQEKVDASPLRKYTPYSKQLLSLPVIGGLLLVNILLIIVLTVLGHRTGSGHIPIGWGFIISGLAVIAGGLLFRPSYEVTAPFLQTVLNGYFNFFTTAVVVIAGIFTIVGAFIFLVGNAASDREE